ncbi:hypothetical protein IAT38_000676 [Cryptococcus sp. DSM 104549]
MFIQTSALFSVLSLLTLPLTLAGPISRSANSSDSTSSADSQTASSPVTIIEQLEPTIEALRQKYGVPGISIGYAVSPDFTQEEAGATLGEGDWTLGTATFGTADRYNNSVDADTLFSIASNTKLFTALSVGLLIANGTTLPNGQVLSLTTKIKDILPDWELLDEYASDHVDVLDLMSMRSGLPRHDFSNDWVTADQVVSNLRNLKPTTEIRQAWQYSNLHYVALSQIIPTLTGVSYTDFVQTHIFDALGLDSATFNATAAYESGHRSDGFLRQGMNRTQCAEVVLKGNLKVDETCLGTAKSIGWWSGDRDESLGSTAAGGVLMSATDMSKWVKELIQPSVLPAELVASVVQTFSVVTGFASSPLMGIQSYGLAQIVYTYRGFAIHGHEGSVPGHQSLLARLPDQGFGLMVVVNDDEFGSLMCQIVALSIIDAVMGLEPVNWESQVTSVGGSLSSFPEVPSSPRAIPQDVAGQYTNAGYGTLDLVEIPSFNTSEVLPYFPSDWTSTPNPLNLTGPIYLANIDKVQVTHLALTHFDGPLFNWTASWAGDMVDAQNKSAGVLAMFGGTGTAVVAEGGIGLYGVVGQGSTVPATALVETDLAANADVWFVKDA